MIKQLITARARRVSGATKKLLCWPAIYTDVLEDQLVDRDLRNEHPCLRSTLVVLTVKELRSQKHVNGGAKVEVVKGYTAHGRNSWHLFKYTLAQGCFSQLQNPLEL